MGLLNARQDPATLLYLHVMKLRYVIAIGLAIFAGLVTLAHANPPHPPPTMNVTNNPTIQAYLHLAAEYWDARLPSRKPSCGPETVTVEDMAAAQGNGGQIVSGNRIWAETAIDGCQIGLSPNFWAFLNHQPPYTSQWTVTGTMRGDTALACATIAHEYGHTLGLGDTAHGIGLLNGNGNSKLDDPYCNKYAWGWKHLSHQDKLWLIGASISQQ